ncbi:hypothetical protein [Deinococcus maricopensis]|uniref:Uncharacterized protein n=1 Tax=Deinococcus maricopensis (strain DSM 21211 / LMG 22137 / NRRL B-23946 / LB-34) TaxID=709986 RepID=E8U4C8_DEIML|nr:hypothetical protein [Deinococcus maricopensis]ADV65965.1 hypothetical protein Deima_0304 [Deinococcus maricopensis DSM 21211]
MNNIILTFALLTTTFAGAASTPVNILKVQDNGRILAYNELYTEASWQVLTLDAARVDLTGANGDDVTSDLILTDNASDVNVTLDAATLDGGRVRLNVTLDRDDESTTVNKPVTFTLTNTRTGATTTFTAPVVGAAHTDPASIQTFWGDE